MTMEVPPFQRPKPTLQHYLRGVQNPWGNQVQDEGNGEMSEEKEFNTGLPARVLFFVMLNVGKPTEMGCLHPS